MTVLTGAYGAYWCQWVSASRLILCIVAERPLHVVAATDEATGLTYLITTYVADPNLWEVDFKTRRKP